MDGGKILQTGKADDIFYHPSSERVATFLGETNIFEGYVVEKNPDMIVVELSRAKITASGNFEVGTRVKIFVRPENVILKNEFRDMKGENIFHGKVSKIIPRGLFMKVSVDAEIIVVAFLTRQAVKDMNLNEGTDVYIEFKSTSAHTVKK